MWKAYLKELSMYPKIPILSVCMDRWNSGKHSTFRSSFFIVQSNHHNHWSEVEELVFIFSRLLRSFKNRNQISLRQGACRSLNFDIWVLTKAVGLKFKVSCLFVPKVGAFRWSVVAAISLRIERTTQRFHGACHDFTRFFKIFNHCFDFLTQIRKHQHAVHLIFAEKETETHSAVVNTDLVTDRPAKLRVRAPSKANYALRLLTKAIPGCIRKWNKYLLRLSRLRNWKL